MKRMPIVLAFGEHPGAKWGFALSADRRFFKSVIGPFLEEHVKKQGRKAVVIHEYNRGLDNSSLGKVDLKRLKAICSMHDKALNKGFAESFGIGNREMTNVDWFDWGFVDDILAINKEAPHTITSVVEPYSIDALLCILEQRKIRSTAPAGTFEEILEVEKEILKLSAKLCIARNRRLFSYVEALGSEDPERAIIVPRGYAHQGMANLFDHINYDITMACRLRGVPLFSTEAIIEASRKELTEEDWRRFAYLSHCYHSYDSANRGEFLRVAQRIGFNEETIRMLEVKARAYALQMEIREREKGLIG